ncbi:MAG: glutamine-hydrolyzing GMP synthase [Acidobacteria bacterium]|nr:glutamine-hydrolyzing GMP synthase [Acidobacteriota bacterium]MBV9476223.1 glutamine-hydrolyzing GMP synthase [Acidobacteriota bacterium]
MSVQPEQTVLVLDFGSQYTQLIARRIRDKRVYSVVHPFDLAPEKIRAIAPKAIILSGGPQSVYAESAPYCSREIFSLGIPLLGICYGMQLTAYLLDGRVEPATEREYGRAQIDVDANDSPLFANTPAHQRVWASHGDRILAAPPGFTVTASSPSAPIAAFEDRARACYGIQFHPEVTHSEAGSQLLENFLFGIAGCEPSWDLGDFRRRKVEEIREQVGDRNVIAAVSGGVDSSVAALLVAEAIGDQLTAIFVDNGVLRKHEAMQVVSRLSEGLGMHIVAVDGRQRFYEKLAGVEEPEVKRKRIGNEFIAVFEEEAKRIPNVEFLVQGTLYPDVIESVSIKGPSAVIKTHHNVGGLPEKMGLKLIEPVRELFKDEVRQLGIELGLEEEFVWRHPFPGPGLAVRILGEVNAERVEVLQNADEIVIDEIRRAGLYREISQAFAVLLPVKSVGVMGDERTYENVLAIRAVTTTDFMTADWFRMPHDVLDRMARRIVNEVRGVNRVVYDVSSKPPSTIEWE